MTSSSRVLDLRAKILVFGCFFVLGFSPFTFVNALFAEVSVWKNAAPEKSNIGAVMGSSFNISVPFMLLYVWATSVRPLPEKAVIVAVTILEIVGLGIVAIWWDTSVNIGGHDTSIIIIAMSFLSGLVGCVSLVCLFSFAGGYIPLATSSLSAGMGGSGVLTNLLNVIQTHTPRKANYDFDFTATGFFFTSISFPVASLVALAVIVKFGVGLKPIDSLDESLLSAEQGKAGGPKSVIELLPDSQRNSVRQSAVRSSVDALPDIGPSVERRGGGGSASTGNSALLNMDDFDDVDFETSQARNNIKGADGRDASKSVGGALAAGLEDDEPEAPVDWKMLAKVAWKPATVNLCTSIILYFINPGLMPFLTPSSQLISILGFVLQTTNMIGRFVVSFIPFSYTTQLTVLQLGFLIFLCIVGAESPNAVLAGLAVPAVALMALLNGFITTRIYLDADDNAKRFGGQTEFKRARRICSVCNQVGSLVGSYLCLGVVVARGFHPKHVHG